MSDSEIVRLEEENALLYETIKNLNRTIELLVLKENKEAELPAMDMGLGFDGFTCSGCGQKFIGEHQCPGRSGQTSG